MNKKVEKNRTLLVDGPASVTLLSGKTQVFGFQLNRPQKIVIREGKRLPFEVEQEAMFSLSLGAGADFHEVEGSTIPPSWKEACELVIGIERKPSTIMVIGGVDSGKSSFCTYIANRMVCRKCKVAVLDEDLGQSDIGSPATVAYAILSKPVTDLFSLQPQGTFFVGATSPACVVDKTVEAVAILKKEILEKTEIDCLIVNTDGWAAGNEAVAFKQRLAKEIEPDIVFCVEELCTDGSLCASFGDALAGYRQERVSSPSEVRGRDRENRKTLRELGFAKYLEGAKVRVFPINHVTVEGKENYSLILQHRAENMLVALYNKEKLFMGIGVLRGVDYDRKALRILTAVAEKPALLRFGRIRLDKDLREIIE